MQLPELAISVRQPWAWALIFAGKGHENRSAKAISFMRPLIGRRAIHAAKGMTREEYKKGRDFIQSLGIACPPPADLLRGGVIGSVEVTGATKLAASPWFTGPWALICTNPKPCDFIPAVGQLGYFKWKRADDSIVPEPAKWMLPEKPALERDLFMGG